MRKRYSKKSNTSQFSVKDLSKVREDIKETLSVLDTRILPIKNSSQQILDELHSGNKEILDGVNTDEIEEMEVILKDILSIIENYRVGAID